MEPMSMTPEVVTHHLGLLEELTTDLSNQVVRLTDAHDSQAGAWSSFAPAAAYESKLVGVLGGLLAEVEASRQEVLRFAQVLQTNAAGITGVDEATSDRLDALVTRLTEAPEFRAVIQASARGRMLAV